MTPLPHGSLRAGVSRPVTWSTIIRQFGGARNASNAQACWEALHARGIIGTEMLFSPLRVFEGEHMPRGGMPHPTSVGECVAVAYRQREILAAELRWRAATGRYEKKITWWTPGQRVCRRAVEIYEMSSLGVYSLLWRDTQRQAIAATDG